MIKKPLRIFTTFFLILLMQPGCTVIRTGSEVKKAPVVSQELVKTTRSWDGQLLPFYPQGQPEISIRRITIPAGARLETHRHPVINAGIMLSGQLTVVTTDGKTLHLRAGDPIVEVVNTLHYGINQGSVPADLVVFYAGAVNMPITVVVPASEP